MSHSKQPQPRRLLSAGNRALILTEAPPRENLHLPLPRLAVRPPAASRCSPARDLPRLDVYLPPHKRVADAVCPTACELPQLASACKRLVSWPLLYASCSSLATRKTPPARTRASALAPASAPTRGFSQADALPSRTCLLHRTALRKVIKREKRVMGENRPRKRVRTH